MSPTIEGAGVHLKRAFGFHEKPNLDPFLLLDHFASDNPEDYIQGFPWHPHRGIETITYMISGSVEHRDSLGNQGVIEEGDIQWMTAGERDYPSGNAQGRSGRHHGRPTIMGKFTGVEQDDAPALSGNKSQGYP